MTMYFQILAFFGFIVAVVLVWLALVSIASIPFWFFGDVVGRVAALVIGVFTMPLTIMVALRLMGVEVW